MKIRQLLKLGIIGIFAAIASLNHAAAEQSVRQSLSAREIGSLLSDAGLDASLMQDQESGLPVALGNMDGINFVIRALDCDGLPARCKQLLFFANFNLGREVVDQDYKIVNDFNDSNMDGRAYVIEETGEIGVDFYIDLTGGVTSDHIMNRVERWQNVISDFLQEMRAAQTGS
ncbi:MAG: YbjN domain-containing protein [bacterium]